MNSGNILITGGTSGLGFELAKLFCRSRYNVWVTGRSLNAGLPEGMTLHFLRMDFSDLNQTCRAIKELINQGIKFDIVVNNAGVLGPSSFLRTTDGFEYTFQINFLAHLLINDIIFSALDPGDHIKLAIVTSPVHRLVHPGFRMPGKENYESYSVYALSKHYLLLSGDYLKERHKSKDIRLIKFNPGVFRSGIYRMKKSWFHVLYKTAAPFMKSPSIPARKLFELIVSDSVSDRIIYRSLESEGERSPQLTREAWDFLFSCQQAVMIC